MVRKDNSGSLFFNEQKRQDKHPDFTGICLVNGKEMRMAGWKKTSQSGKKYISIAFDNPLPAQKEMPKNDARADDEIPF